MPWIQPRIKERDGLLAPKSPSSPPPSSGSKISPSLLLIIIILAVIFFISGVLHLLIRFLHKQRSSSSISQSNRYPEMNGSDAFRRQLQQLFHLHDSGLDQVIIDALPVFLYKELLGLQEPFDCAVCLCEFSELDKLRLLPLCGHAFHIDCIDTWLLSNSTCPLCRGTLFTPGFSIENPVFEFEESMEQDGFSGHIAGEDHEIGGEKRVFSVRLGKFRSTNIDGGERKEEGESSSNNLDARRCYSMGSFQYVVANSNLQVACLPNRGSVHGGLVRGREGQNGNLGVDRDSEGNKIMNIGSKGESFSVSKIWLWSKKDKFAGSSDTHFDDQSSLSFLLCWFPRAETYPPLDHISDINRIISASA
ncbi:hypothetical protein NMG60_11009003 [Bertholletia excelsa]